jgi:hypothetical protein
LKRHKITRAHAHMHTFTRAHVHARVQVSHRSHPMDGPPLTNTTTPARRRNRSPRHSSIVNPRPQRRAGPVVASVSFVNKYVGYMPQVSHISSKLHSTTQRVWVGHDPEREIESKRCKTSNASAVPSRFTVLSLGVRHASFAFYSAPSPPSLPPARPSLPACLPTHLHPDPLLAAVEGKLGQRHWKGRLGLGLCRWDGDGAGGLRARRWKGSDEKW